MRRDVRTNRVASAMHIAGFTKQADYARACGIAKDVVNRCINDPYRIPSIKNARAMAKTSGVTVAFVTGGAE